MKPKTLGLLALALLTGPMASISAYALTTVTLGEQDFTDGQIFDSATYNTASSNEAAPFNGFIGSDPFGPNFSATFTFNYAPGSFTSANLSLGLFDHDSANSGDQVASFLVDGIDLTAVFNALLNSFGGSQAQYNVYSFDLTGLGLAALADGSATFSLALLGPTAGCISGVCPNNGAGLDFATLSLQSASVPEPGTLALLGIGLVGLGFSRRKAA